MNTLIVATFNIRNARALDGRHNWVARRRCTVDAIASLEADVIGLQEVFAWARRYVVRRLEGYEAHGVGRSGGSTGEQCPVLIRNELLRLESTSTCWFSAAPDTPDTPGARLPGASFPRIATHVRLRGPLPTPLIDVWNVHLDEHVAEHRIHSTEQLASWLTRDTPTIVLGDFNAVPEDAEVFIPLRDAGLTAAGGADLHGTAHGFTGRLDGPRLDHIFVSAHWQVEHVAVHATPQGRRLPSDHWPLRAVLRAR